MKLFGAHGAGAGAHAPMGGGGWHSQSDEHSNPAAEYQRQDDPPAGGWENKMRKVQYSVATSTFSVILFMGIFCSCLYLGCCRQKRERRVRGNAWSNNASFANAPIESNGSILDPHGLHLNPYMISPYVQTQLFGADVNTSNGFYHLPQQQYPAETKHEDVNQNVKEHIDGAAEVKKDKSESTYKPFLPKMDEWLPPTEPPTYQSLGLSHGHENPAYMENESSGKYGEGGFGTQNVDMDKKPHSSESQQGKIVDYGNESGRINYAEIHSTPYNPDYQYKTYFSTQDLASNGTFKGSDKIKEM